MATTQVRREFSLAAMQKTAWGEGESSDAMDVWTALHVGRGPLYLAGVLLQVLPCEVPVPRPFFVVV